MRFPIIHGSLLRNGQPDEKAIPVDLDADMWAIDLHTLIDLRNLTERHASIELVPSFAGDDARTVIYVHD